MADVIKAIQAYSPRVKLGMPVEIRELVSYIASRTGLNQGPILNVLMELRDALVFFNKAGRPVKLEGLGTFSPGMDKSGAFRVNHRPDKELINELNTPGDFGGEIKNRDMVGKSASDYIARWNEEHPDDPINK